MKLSKAQQVDFDGVHILSDDLESALQDVGDLQVELEFTPESPEDEELLASEPSVEGDLVVESPDGELSAEKHFEFSLGKIPGSDDDEELVVEEEPEEIEMNEDPWKWNISGFLPWLDKKLKNVPRHSGRDLSGVERAISYLKECAKHVRLAAKQDINDSMAIDELEKALDSIYDGIERLEARREKIETIKDPYKKKRTKKATADEQELVKTAWRAGKFDVNVPIFISYVARVCINSHVSAGHSLTETLKKMAKKFEMTEREKVSTMQVLEDMGYPIFRDRGLMLGEEFDPTSTENFDFPANYPG